jgi:hypothetical protein
VKILYWDRDDWAIWYKRLEAGTFQFPFSETGRKEVAAWELAVLLEGIDLKKGKHRERYGFRAGCRMDGTYLELGLAPGAELILLCGCTRSCLGWA